MASLLKCLVILSFSCVAVLGQQTPSQILAEGAPLQALSDRDIQIYKSTLLSLMAFGVVSPSQTLSQGAAFQALDDKSLQVSQATLMSLMVNGAVNPNQTLSQGAAFQALDSRSIEICIATLLNSVGSNSLVINSLTNVVAPSVFSAPAGDWNPIVITGAGTAAANGNYYRSVSNALTIAGVTFGYGVWTNSSGGNYYLIRNDTNVLAGGITGPITNFWTIQDIAGDNSYYFMASSTPFGSWEVSSLAGIAGDLPTPHVGSTTPPLVTAVNSTNQYILLLPGLHDIGAYTLFPTNKVILAGGSTILARTGSAGTINAHNSFEMYGGTVTNGSVNFTLDEWASPPLVLDSCTNANLHGVSFYGIKDGIHGSTAAGSKFLMVGGNIGTFWDALIVTSSGAQSSSAIIGVNILTQGVDFGIGTNGLHGIHVSGFASNFVSACNVLMTNSATSGYAIGNGAEPMTVLGTSIETRSVLGTVSKITSGGGVVTAVGCTVTNGDTSGPVYFPGLLVSTNHISGAVYTNFYGLPVNVTIPAVLSVSGIWQARALGVATNSFIGVGTNVMSVRVPTNGRWTFTNTAGTGTLQTGGDIFLE